MHLTLNLGNSYKNGLFFVSYDFMFDRIMCVLVRIKVKGHFVMSIIQFMNSLAWISGQSAYFTQKISEIKDKK